MEWKPIETAPKDGSRIITFSHGLVGVSRWSERFADIYGWERGPAFYSESLDRPHFPTHWMHLPQPPSKAKGE